MIRFFRNQLMILASVSMLGMSVNAKAQDVKPEGDKTLKAIEELAKKIETLREKRSDTLATGGGSMEAAILSSEAINAGATAIASQIVGDSFVIIASDTAVDTDSYIALDLEIAAMQSLLTLNAPKKVAVPVVALAVVPGATAAISATLDLLTGLLRSETEISDLAGSLTDHQLLAIATADKLIERKKPVTLPGRIVLNDPSNDQDIISVAKRLAQLDQLANAIQFSKDPNPQQQAAVARYVLFLARIQTPVNGVVPIIAAIKARKQLSAMKGGSLLRVKIEKAGGTLLKRKNLAVSLGASALGITGGAVISYTLSDFSGNVTKAGLLHCGTTLTNFRKVHKRTAIKGRCNI